MRRQSLDAFGLKRRFPGVGCLACNAVADWRCSSAAAPSGPSPHPPPQRGEGDAQRAPPPVVLQPAAICTSRGTPASSVRAVLGLRASAHAVGRAGLFDAAFFDECIGRAPFMRVRGLSAAARGGCRGLSSQRSHHPLNVRIRGSIVGSEQHSAAMPPSRMRRPRPSSNRPSPMAACCGSTKDASQQEPGFVKRRARFMLHCP